MSKQGALKKTLHGFMAVCLLHVSCIVKVLLMYITSLIHMCDALKHYSVKTTLHIS